MQTYKMVGRSMGLCCLLFFGVLLGAQSSWRGVSQVDIFASNIASPYTLYAHGIDWAGEIQNVARWNYGAWLGLEKEIGGRWAWGVLMGYHQQGLREKLSVSTPGTRQGGHQSWVIHQLSAPVYVSRHFGRRKLQYYARTSLRPGLQLTTSGDLDGLFIEARKGLLNADLEAGVALALTDKQSLRLGWVIFGGSLLPVDKGGREQLVYTGFRLNYVWAFRDRP